MSFQLLSRKVSAVRESFNEWQLQSLEAGFAKIAKEVSSQRIGSEASRGYLFVEIAFALLRHREWIEVPVFQALVVEFLQLDHGLPHMHAQKLVLQMMSDCRRLGLMRARTLCVDDREFLTYAYVAAAGAHNDVDLELELGLGSALVRKLRDGVRVLDEAKVDTFVPEYDAMLASIVVELTHQVRERPWALDEQRLKFKLLSELADDAVPWILEEQLPQTLTALAEIGRGKSDCPEDLLKILERAQLLLAEKDGRGRIRGWSLTKEGAKLTAGVFRARYGTEVIQDISAFLALDLTWQIAILRDSHVSSLGFVMELLSNHLARMAPWAVETAVERIAGLGPDVLEADTVRGLLGAARLPWHKAAVLRALRDVNPTDEIAGIVADALSQESSGSMIEAAGVLLDRWGHRQL